MDERTKLVATLAAIIATIFDQTPSEWERESGDDGDAWPDVLVGYAHRLLAAAEKSGPCKCCLGHGYYVAGDGSGKQPCIFGCKEPAAEAQGGEGEYVRTATYGPFPLRKGPREEPTPAGLVEAVEEALRVLAPECIDFERFLGKIWKRLGIKKPVPLLEQIEPAKRFLEAVRAEHRRLRRALTQAAPLAAATRDVVKIAEEIAHEPVYTKDAWTRLGKALTRLRDLEGQR